MKRHGRLRWLVLGLVGLIIIIAVLVIVVRLAHAPAPSVAVPGASTTTSPLAHVVVILEENKAIGSVIGSPSAPYINQLAEQGALAANYYDVAKPSLPNYLALTGGTTGGIKTDCSPGPHCQLTNRSIADQLEAAKRTWKEYAESMPAPCAMANSGRYAVRHDPFVYYTRITHDQSRCQAHIVPFDTLATDLKSTSSLPNYVLVTPNVCDDMHDCSVATGDAWLKRQVPSILRSPAFTKQKSLLIIVWDEGSKFNHHIPAIFIGPAAKPHTVSHQRYDHYALLRTIEAGLGIKPVGPHDQKSPIMTDMLR